MENVMKRGRHMRTRDMEEVLKSATKVIIDPSAKGVIPYLPLPELKKQAGGAR